MGKGHCILLFKLNDSWYINDYTRIYKGFSTPAEAIMDYNAVYPVRYQTQEVVFNGLVKYDYEKGKFYTVNLSELK